MDNQSENTREQDSDWSSLVQVIIESDSRLKAEQTAIIETDFGMSDSQLAISWYFGSVRIATPDATKSIRPRCMQKLQRSR